MGDLKNIRVKIDEIDKQIVSLLEERMKLVAQVAKYKSENNKPILDEEREKQVIEKNLTYLKEKEYSEVVQHVFETIMSTSRSYQRRYITGVESSNKKDVVGFQGVSGSYSEEAVMQYFKGQVKRTPLENFKDVFEELEKGNIDYGVLPIENSSTGAIAEVYDLLRAHDFYIVGESCVKIDHNLLTVKGSKLEDIKEVFSHPQGLLQCNNFLKQYQKWKLISYPNTAVSAKYIKEKDDKSKAAIASKRAAELYGLDILKENINFSNKNTTRFIVISKTFRDNTNANKLSVVLSTQHTPGSLFKLLKIFSEYNLNMLKIESRPIVNKSWEYFFYIDLEGNMDDEIIRRAMEDIKRNCYYFKFLGNYERDQ